MKFELSQNPKVGYSEREQQVFSLLPQGKPKSEGEGATYITIVPRLYRDPKRRPYHARVATIQLLNGLARKVLRNDEEFKVMRTRRAGPYPIQFWIEGKR